MSSSGVAWFWPSYPNGASAPSVAVLPFSLHAATGVPLGVVTADWYTSDIWAFLQSASGSVARAGSLDLGYVAAVPDPTSSTQIWALQYGGPLCRVRAGSPVGVDTFPLPGNYLYGGLVYASGQQPYVLQIASGTVLTSSATQLGTFGAPAYGLAGSGTALYSMLIGQSKIGTMTTGGVTGTIALPSRLAHPTCIQVASGMPLAVGGTADNPAFRSNVAAYQLSPAASGLMLGVGSNAAATWTNDFISSTDAWVTGSVLSSGLANLTSLSWAANGTQALATDPVSGVVQVLQYVTSTLALQQTLSLAGAGAVAVLPSSVDALVCCTSANIVRPLIASGGNWSVSGSSLSLTGPNAVVATGPGAAAVGYASGVALLLQTGGIWAVAATGALSFAPTQVVRDPQGLLYFTGASAFAVCSGTTVTASGALTYAPTATAIDQGRWIMACPAISGLVVFGQTGPSTWAQSATATGLAGTPRGVAVAGTTIFTGAKIPYNTVLLNLSGQVYQPLRVQIGAVATWNGSIWTSASLGIGVIPSALAFDASGNVLVACTNNNFYTVSQSGTVLSSGVVQPFPAQTLGAPLGLSALYVSGALVYASTSIAGNLTQVV